MRPSTAKRTPQKRARVKNNALHKDVEDLRENVISLVDNVKKTSTKQSDIMIKKAMKSPWKSLGIACGVGFIAGFLFRK